MRKFTLLPLFTGIALVSGCQTHDRVMYDTTPEPVRLNSVKMAEPRSISGQAPASGEIDLPPEPGQSGLEGPTLIP